MPTISANLQTQVDPANTKTAWSTTVTQLLGNSRRVRCFRDPNSNALDPTVTGVEFLNIGSTGAMQITSGNITGFGTLSGTTIRQAADLSTGSCALRVEGNGYAITYTLGLVGSGKEFMLPSSPTGAANMGFAFSAGAGMRAPIFLDSGTGPLSPAPDASTVTAFRLCDYSTGARVVVGTAPLSYHEPNVVLELPWMAAEIGDIRRMRTPDNGIITWGTGGDSYLVGGDIVLSNPVTNGDASVPLQQVEIRMMPNTGLRWSTWPFKGAFNIATDTMTPPPHKIELLNGAGAIVDVIEMYSSRDTSNTPGSGKPVNDPSLTQDWNGATNPVQCKWTCRMTHQWFSHKPKVHSKAFHFLPGVMSPALDPQNVVAFPSDPDQWPVITDNNLQNGLHSYRIAPKWSRVKYSGLDTTVIDTYFTQPAREDYISQAVGYGFEPASAGKQTWYMAPGGSRHDRGGFPYGIVMWASNPTGSRIHGNVPWREMVHHWMMSYFNHAWHYFTDVAKGYGIPKQRVLNGEICYNGTYYSGGNEDYRPNIGTSAVDLLSYVNGAHRTDNPNLPYSDKNGNRFSNEWARDYLHSIPTSALGGYLTTSPRHILNARHAFTSHVLCCFNYTQGFDKNEFLIRAHAWHMWQFANIWVCSNDHPDCFTLAEIEAMWGAHLEHVYDAVMPEYLAQNTVYGVSLKRFGIHMKEVPNGDGTVRIEPNADLDSKVFYAAQVFMFMKQTGSYAKMRARSSKCAATLDMMFDCLTTYATGVMIDANGRTDRYGSWRSYPPLPNSDPGNYVPTNTAGGIANLPPTWNELYPQVGSDDWIRFADGSMTIVNNSVDNVNTKHYRAQWLWMVRDFYPEKVTTRVTQAISIVDSFYAQVEAARPNTYWTFRFAMMGQFKAPDYIGAPQ